MHAPCAISRARCPHLGAPSLPAARSCPTVPGPRGTTAPCSSLSDLRSVTRPSANHPTREGAGTEVAGEGLRLRKVLRLGAGHSAGRGIVRKEPRPVNGRRWEGWVTAFGWGKRFRPNRPKTIARKPHHTTRNAASVIKESKRARAAKKKRKGQGFYAPAPL